MTNSLLVFPLPEFAGAVYGAARALPLPLSGTAAAGGSGPIGSASGLVVGSEDPAGAVEGCTCDPVCAADEAEPGVCGGNRSWSPGPS